jgi:hypothetical protein
MTAEEDADRDLGLVGVGNLRRIGEHLQGFDQCVTGFPQAGFTKPAPARWVSAVQSAGQTSAIVTRLMVSPSGGAVRSGFTFGSWEGA